MQSVGVDGCKAGWFAVSIYDYDKWEFSVCKSIEELCRQYTEADIVLIDIPIGLKDSGIQERLCDLEARKMLGPGRRSSVFPVPCRQAVYSQTYYEANQINKKILGIGLPQQTWGIVPKIREVDSFLVNNDCIKNKLVESHPEVCFYALCGRPMQYSKKCRNGVNERITVLRRIYQNTDEVINFALNNYRRKELALDDILDALCLAVSGLQGLKKGFSVIPQKPEKDLKGLDMKIVFSCS